MNAIVIDGYNVIYAIPDLRRKILEEGPKSAREAFIDICSRYKGSMKDISRIYIVFDGRKLNEDISRKDTAGVSVVFSHGGKEADDIIIDLLKDNAPARHFIVISSDNYVQNNSRIYSACLMTPMAFCRELEKKLLLPKKRDGWPLNNVRTYREKIVDEYREKLKGRNKNY